jgi:transcriptional regulator with XRE-family HTH domain
VGATLCLAVASIGNSGYARCMSDGVVGAASLLRELRGARGRSLRSAAADIGVAPSQLSRLERGERGMGPDMPAKLASYYGVSPDLISLAHGEVPTDVLLILQDHPELLDMIRQQFGRGSAGDSSS